jgi:hypothetical protein
MAACAEFLVDDVVGQTRPPRPPVLELSAAPGTVEAPGVRQDGQGAALLTERDDRRRPPCTGLVADTQREETDEQG